MYPNDATWPVDDDMLADDREMPAARVLVAEDDDDLRHLLVVTLRSAGYRVIEARDGEQLLAMVSQRAARRDDDLQGIDLIVSDIRMPGPNGLWVLATLRHIDWATPFVVITAFADDRTLAEARRLGATAVLSKPFDLEEFRSTVLNVAGPPAA